jgi:hypothetical protein
LILIRQILKIEILRYTGVLYTGVSVYKIFLDVFKYYEALLKNVFSDTLAVRLDKKGMITDISCTEKTA